MTERKLHGEVKTAGALKANGHHPKAATELKATAGMEAESDEMPVPIMGDVQPEPGMDVGPAELSMPLPDEPFERLAATRAAPVPSKPPARTDPNWPEYPWPQPGGVK